ncbi:MAG: amidohydrolase family protein, partial [Planctomycetota bacterium]
PVVLYTARWLLAAPDQLYSAAGLLVRDGRVAQVARGPSALRRLATASGERPVDLGEGLLVPGMVDAHAHLELGLLAGRLSRDAGFGAWVARVVELRAAAEPAELAQAVLAGADRLLATGTTAVGDIDSSGAAAGVLRRHPLRTVLYREVLDAGDPARTASAARAVEHPLEEGEGFSEGLSPHAPFTVSPALLGRLGEIAAARSLPLTVHWSETLAELQWLEHGEGPLAGLLGVPPGGTGLELLDAAGLLGPRTSLVHGNHPRGGEPERLAAAGVTLVHCPGTHAYFRREPFPIQRYTAAGVSLALGTDSLASNTDLDLRLEMALLRAAHPRLEPATVWSMATEGGARALGLGNSLGCLEAGRRADFCLVQADGRDLGSLLEALTAGLPPVLGVWIAGERVGPRAAHVSDR